MGKPSATGAFLAALSLSGCMALEGKLSRAFMKPATLRLPSPAEVNLAFEDVRIEVASGVALHGWFLPSTESSGLV